MHTKTRASHSFYFSLLNIMNVNPALRNPVLMIVSLGSCMENPCRVSKLERPLFELRNMVMDGIPQGLL